MLARGPTVVIAAITLAVMAIAGGTLVSYAYDDEAPLSARLAYGTASGFVALATIGFVLANFIPIGAASVLAGVIVVLPLLCLAMPRVRDLVRADVRALRASLALAVRDPTLSNVGPLLYTVAFVGALFLIFDNVIVERDGALFSGFVNNLGDLPFHMQVTSSFAFGQNFPPEDPTYAGTGFAYPYLADFLSAQFMSVGAVLRDAYFLQHVLLGLAMVGLLHRFTRVITGDRLAAFLAPVIVVLSGGLGWIAFLDDARAAEGGVLGLLAALPQDYTIVSEGPYRWGNAITTLLVTQRSLLFGLPTALIAFTLLWKLIHAPAPDGRTLAWSAPSTRLALAAGLLTGALPLVHAHSFVVVMGTAFLFGLLFRQWRENRWIPWAVFVTAALVVALPEIWWSTHDSIANAGTFFGFEFGWDHGDLNIAWFWFLNTGLFVPLALIAAFWPSQPRVASRTLLLFSAAFLAWFIVPNVMKLAPWVWDNIKVLFYWFVGFVPLVAVLLSRWFQRGPPWRTIAALSLIAMTLAGTIDIWRAVSGQTMAQEFDRDGIAVAELIRTRTPPQALILHAPTYNPPVFLTGRRSLLGYTGYIWAHGLPYVDRENDIKRIYAGEPDAAQLIERYAIDYVLVSPIERGSMTVNDAFFEDYELVGQSGEYKLYDVSS